MVRKITKDVTMCHQTICIPVHARLRSFAADVNVREALHFMVPSSSHCVRFPMTWHDVFFNIIDKLMDLTHTLRSQPLCLRRSCTFRRTHARTHRHRVISWCCCSLLTSSTGSALYCCCGCCSLLEPSSCTIFVDSCPALTKTPWQDWALHAAFCRRYLGFFIEAPSRLIVSPATWMSKRCLRRSV